MEKTRIIYRYTDAAIKHVKKADFNWSTKIRHVTLKQIRR